jgi:iron complex outermembrane receptor protein
VPVSLHAQRVDENAVEQAQDAFGFTIGDEQVGLYSPDDARGFSPKDAGNLVIEGLYYDQQTFAPTSRIVEGSVLHVGLSAQSYPLAAPTGPGMPLAAGQSPDHEHLGRRRSLRQRLRRGRRADPDRGVAQRRLGASIYLNPTSTMRGTRTHLGRSARALATDTGIEIVPFYGWASYIESEVHPLVFLAGSARRPFEQRKLPGQSWTDRDDDEIDYGVLGRFELGQGWMLRTGLFGSRMVQHDSTTNRCTTRSPTAPLSTTSPRCLSRSSSRTPASCASRKSWSSTRAVTRWS